MDLPGSWISAGRVGRPHGLDGSFRVTAPKPALLEEGAELRVGQQTMSVRRRAGTERAPILALNGVDDRDAASALRGLDLLVVACELPPLPEDEWWAHELQGCIVSDGDVEVGRVVRLIELPSCEALEVSRGEGPSLLIPMVKDAIRRIDVERERIDVDLAFLGEEPYRRRA